jgi:hypothetical protein
MHRRDACATFLFFTAHFKIAFFINKPLKNAARLLPVGQVAPGGLKRIHRPEACATFPFLLLFYINNQHSPSIVFFKIISSKNP